MKFTSFSQSGSHLVLCREKKMKTIDKTHVIRWIIRSFPFYGTRRMELIAKCHSFT
jgi:hypothetical protein